MSIAVDFIAQQNKLLDLLGTQLEYTDTTGVAVFLRGAVSPFGRDDGELINSIGIEGRKIQLSASSVRPEKFGTFREPVSNMTYAIIDVREAVVDGKAIGYLCVVKS